jgi:uncharacterized delta-60 repeat protein
MFHTDFMRIECVGTNAAADWNVEPDRGALMSLSRNVVALAILPATLLFAPPCLAVDGTPDPGFGVDGISFITPDDIEARQLHPYATAVLPDGSLLFGGFRSQFNPEVPFEPVLRAMVARMQADGSVDTDFGNSSIPGVAVLPDIAADSRIQSIEAMQVLDDGSIIAAGSAFAHAPATGFVTRLHADGSVDATFGDAGMSRLAFTELHALAIDSQGRLVVAGTNVEDFDHSFGTVARFTADGILDPGFGEAGIRAVDWDASGHSSYLEDLALGSDDSIVVGGRYSLGGAASDFAIARLDSEGAYDTTFAGSGWRLFHAQDVASSTNNVERLVLAPDGAIAFAGQYTNAGGKRALVFGRLLADGTTDAGFGDTASPGYLRPAILPDAFVVDATDLLMQDDGKLIASVSYYSPTIKDVFIVLRTTAAGLSDPDFADAGVLQMDLAPDGTSSDAASMALQADGRLVVAGAAERTEPLIDLAVVRLLNGASVADPVFADGFE